MERLIRFVASQGPEAVQTLQYYSIYTRSGRRVCTEVSEELIFIVLISFLIPSVCFHQGNCWAEPRHSVNSWKRGTWRKKKKFQGSKNSPDTWLLLWHKSIIYGFNLQSCYTSDIPLHRNSGWIIQIIEILLPPQLEVCGTKEADVVCGGSVWKIGEGGLHFCHLLLRFCHLLLHFMPFIASFLVSKWMEIWGYSKIVIAALEAFPQIFRNLNFFFPCFKLFC